MSKNKIILSILLLASFSQVNSLGRFGVGVVAGVIAAKSSSFALWGCLEGLERVKDSDVKRMLLEKAEEYLDNASSIIKKF